MGIFGDLFDFNNDGRLDSLEQATEFGAFMNLIDGEDDFDDEKQEEAKFNLKVSK